MNRTELRALAIAALTFTITTDRAAADQNAPARARAVKWFTVDGGGGRSEGTRFGIEGTIGQPDAGGPMTGGRFALVGGFWAIQARGAPVLTVAPVSPGQARVSWEPDDPGWILQETTDLAAGFWSNSASGSANPVTVPIVPRAKFFRLAKP